MPTEDPPDPQQEMISGGGAEASPRASGTGKDLLLPLQQITEVSRSIAFAVAKVAQEQGHALKISDAQLHARIDQIFWTPHYRHYKRISL